MNYQYFTKKYKLSTLFFLWKRYFYFVKSNRCIYSGLYGGHFPKINKSNKKNIHYLSIKEINKMSLTNCIKELPKPIKNLIYIFWIKKYYKQQLLCKSLKPIWYDHKVYVEKQLLLSKLNNVHFLHLDFNTLPENKKYILGCQCKFCKNYVKNNPEIVIYQLLHQISNLEYFNTTVPSTETIWNSQIHAIINKDNLDILYFIHIFNPLYDVFIIK